MSAFTTKLKEENIITIDSVHFVSHQKDRKATFEPQFPSHPISSIFLHNYDSAVLFEVCHTQSCLRERTNLCLERKSPQSFTKFTCNLLEQTISWHLTNMTVLSQMDSSSSGIKVFLCVFQLLLWQIVLGRLIFIIL